jgi:Carboxypeptidase regulatory-like domain/TonB-dependent Receptor Plug Domain
MKQRIFVVFVMSLMLALSVSVMAQTSKGIITGVVTDSTGAVVSGASVTATSQDTGEKRTVLSGPTGSFRIEAINPGNYNVVFSKSGFKTLTTQQVVVQASIQTPVDGRLEIGSTDTEITVQSQGNEVQTENGELSHAIGTTEITELPVGSLNPIQLAMTEPGVSDVGAYSRNVANGTGFSVNGLNPRENNFLLDGQDNNDNSIQGQAFQPQNGAAIQEVTILTNSYSAEFGRGGASVTNVVYKSGTNQYHGSAWELYQGSGLNAVDGQAAISGTTSDTKIRSDQHSYGFTAGGPIVKDKLFVFGTSQWQRFYGKAAPSTISLPTAAGAAALQAYGTPNALLLLKYIGNLRGVTNPSNVNFCTNACGIAPIEFGLVQRAAPAQSSPDTQWNIKVDYLLSQKDSFSVRYLHDQSSLSPDFFNFPSSLPGFDTLQGGPSENVQATWTHTFNPRAVNEFRASFGHFDFQFAPEAETLANPLYTAPRITISSISKFPLLGVSSALPQGRGHQTYQVQDALTFTSGRNIYKVGFDIARLIIRDAVPFNFFGTETYSAGGGYTPLGNFLDDFSGTGTFASKTFGTPVTRPRMLQQAYYITDTFKATSHLTIDAGLRYEFQPNPMNQLAYPCYDLSKGPNTTLTAPVRCKDDGNNFAPRLSIAYAPSFFKKLFGENKTVLRAGYGMFYDSFYTNMLDNAVGSAPNAIATTVVGSGNGGRGIANSSTVVPAMTPTLNALASETSVNSNFVNPLIHQWNANIQRELPGNFIVTAAYVGTRGIRLFESDTINPQSGYNPVNLAAGKFSYLPRLNAARGAITVRDNSGNSKYNGFNTKVERRFSHGLMLRSAYTYGKGYDNGSDVFSSFSNTVVPQDTQNRAAEWGPSGFDTRHRWVTTYVWQLPTFKNHDGFMKPVSWVANGWEWTGSLAFQSGPPGTIYASVDTNGDGNTVNGRPFLGNPNAPFNSVGVDGIFIGGTPGTLYDNDTGAPTTADAVRYIVKLGNGNVGRNTYNNPGFYNWDSAVARHIKITEKHDLMLRAEFYNLLNHKPQVNGVDTNVLDGKDFFLNGPVAEAGGRTIKLMLKYQF